MPDALPGMFTTKEFLHPRVKARGTVRFPLDGSGGLDGLQVKDALAAVSFPSLRTHPGEGLLSRMSKMSKQQNTQKVKCTPHAMLHRIQPSPKHAINVLH